MLIRFSFSLAIENFNITYTTLKKTFLKHVKSNHQIHTADGWSITIDHRLGWMKQKLVATSVHNTIGQHELNEPFEMQRPQKIQRTQIDPHTPLIPHDPSKDTVGNTSTTESSCSTSYILPCLPMLLVFFTSRSPPDIASSLNQPALAWRSGPYMRACTPAHAHLYVPYVSADTPSAQQHVPDGASFPT